MKISKTFHLAAALGGLLLTAHFAAAQPCVPAPTGAVAWWRAENDVLDAVGSHDSGTLQGGASFAAGRAGQGFSFDGATGSYVSVPDSPAWDFGMNDFTIELWTKMSVVKDSMFIHQQSGASFGGFEFDFLPAHLGGSLLFAPNPFYGGILRPWTASPDTWYHLAVTRQAGTYRLYVDGVQLGAVEADPEPVQDVTGPLRIGSWSDGSGLGVNGLIDELSIFSRALSAMELQGIYSAGSAGKCAPPDCSPNLLVNGSFEDPGVAGGYVHVPGGSSLIPGWTTLFGGVDWYNPFIAPSVLNGGPPAQGGYMVQLDYDDHHTHGGIQQTFATVPGRRYQLSFSFGTSQGRDWPSPAWFFVQMHSGGSLFYGRTLTALARSSNLSWNRHSSIFTAPGDTTTLEFIGNTNRTFLNLDDVRVTDCPESLAGFGGSYYSTLGGALAVVSSNQLFISNFGTQGTGGLRFDAAGMHAFSLVLGDLETNALTEGASLRFAAFGSVSSNADTLISALRATRAGSELQISADYSSIGAAYCTIQIFDGANLVAQVFDQAGMVARVIGSVEGSRWNPFVSDPGSARPWSMIEFPSRPLLALSGGAPVAGTRLIIRPQANRITQPINPIVTPTYTIGWPWWVQWHEPGPYVIPPWRNPGDPPPNEVFIGSLTRFEFTGQGAGTLRILETRAGMFGLDHKAVGGAALSGAGTLLFIDNPSLDPAGVTIFAGGAEEWGSGTGIEFDARWLDATPQPDLPDFSPPVGAFLQANLTGSTNDGTNQLLATIQALKLGSNSITIQGSFPGLLVPAPTLEIWHGSTLTFTGWPPPAVTAGYWPDGFDGVIPPGCPAPGQGCPGPDPTISFRWSAPVTFKFPGLTNPPPPVIGDRIRFVASDPIPHSNIKFEHFALFTGGGLGGLQVISEHISQAGQFFSGLSHLPIGQASLAVSSNEFLVTNLGTSNDYGASVALGSASFAEVSVVGPIPAAPEGAEVRVKSYGELNGVRDQLIGSLIATKVGTNLQFSADLAPLDAPLPGSPTPDGPITDVHYLIFDGPIIVAGGPFTNTIRIPNKLRLAWLAGPWQMFRPGAFRASIELSNRTPVIISGQPSVLGTRVEFQVCWTCGNPSPQPSLRDAPSLSRVDLVAHGLPSFIISHERLGLLAQAHEAAGLARILGVGKELHVRNLVSGAANPDGIDFPLGADYLTNNFTASWRPVDAWSLMPTGMIRAIARGSVTGGLDQVLGSTTITKLGLLKEIFADYGPVFPSSRRVEVLSNNIVVFSTSLQGASGVVGSVNDWPMGCGKTTVGPVGPLLCFYWRFWPHGQFLINSNSVSGDEIRILAENTPFPYAHLTQFSLRAAGMDELILTATAAEHLNPIIIKAQRFGDTRAISWDTPNLRQILQSAGSISGPWGDVPGVTVSPYFAPIPTGSNQFLRVFQR